MMSNAPWPIKLIMSFIVGVIILGLTICVIGLAIEYSSYLKWIAGGVIATAAALFIGGIALHGVELVLENRHAKGSNRNDNW